MLAITRANHRWGHALWLCGLVLAVQSSSLCEVRAEDTPSAPPVADATAAAQTREKIRDMIGGMRDVPLPVIVEALSDHRVLPWKGEGRELLSSVANSITGLIESSGIEAARMNEAGNQVENIVIEAMHRLGLDARRPKAESGRVRSSGYPDLEVEIEGVAFYVEVKAFSAATIDSTQRSFYLSPSTDFKVTRDAIHLLIAVELSPGMKGNYQARSVRWLDLSGLQCDLKYEFNASNRDLYGRTSSLVVLEAVRDPAAHPATESEPAAVGDR